ncbi:uncharacterized protein V1516DRAFT_673834 [Lipomyces oligophaga]|uniref:uncharacterized protein n=1 Tax=Lipomyces oligophaga TaxID=45792 RepID=UPI0034CFE851
MEVISTSDISAMPNEFISKTLDRDMHPGCPFDLIADPDQVSDPGPMWMEPPPEIDYEVEEEFVLLPEVKEEAENVNRETYREAGVDECDTDNIDRVAKSKRQMQSIENQTNTFFRNAIRSNGQKITLRQKRSRFLRKEQGSRPVGSYGSDVGRLMMEIEADQSREETIDPYGPAGVVSKELWVEKWRATRWVDLVGDERSHRQILRWIQQWSMAVFKRDMKVKQKHINEEYKDVFQRPYKKILLIHGPPGLGKTTVAHVAAKQAGYDVLEINASDERSGPAVRAKINNALESHRVGSKPVCIIADEIDGGAESGFIKVLLDLLASDTKAHYTSGNQKKGNKPGKFLLRPIIAICNDPYVPALRTLRPQTELLSYRKSPTSMIVKRLREICLCEKLAIDSRSLKELVENMDGDVRGCINTLQFEGGRSSSNRQKDISSSTSATISRVFQQDSSQSSDKARRLSKLIEQIESNGEFDRITTGCFSLYAAMQYTDTDGAMKKPVEAGEWLFFYDALANSMYRDQHGDLAPYLAYAAGAFHALFSNKANTVEIVREVNASGLSRANFECYEKLRATREIARQLISQAPASTYAMFRSDSSIVSELGPFLRLIINPAVSPMNGSVVSDNDREKVGHAVQVMLDMGIKLEHRKTDSGAYLFTNEPAVEEVSLVRREEIQKAIGGKYVVRQVLYQELERASILLQSAAARARNNVMADVIRGGRKNSAGDSGGDGPRESGMKARSKRSSTAATGEDEANDDINVDNNIGRKRLALDSTSASARPFVSFFEHISAKQDRPDDQEQSWGAHTRRRSNQQVREQMRLDRSQRTWVQYHEGYSDAVKKPITWSDFWRSL